MARDCAMVADKITENIRDVIEEMQAFDQQLDASLEASDLMAGHNRTEAMLCQDLERSNTNSAVWTSLSNTRMRVALGVLVRLVLPLINGVTRRLRAIRNIRASRQVLTNLLAYAANSVSMGLSSVQVAHKIDPILKKIKLRKDINPKAICTPNVDGPAASAASIEDDVPDKCVTINILAAPPPGEPIRADVVLIHGLHGSLVKTWKQGLWNSDGRRVKFQRPPKPPLRPPKRPRHSRTTPVNPPHKSKRARVVPSDMQPSSPELCKNAFEWSGDYLNGTTDNDTEDLPYETFFCDEPETTEFLDEVEYSFPSLCRMSLNDSDDERLPMEDETINQPKKTKRAANTDPDYSKCWPGDWLPLDCPGVRVIALNYTTDPYLWRPVWVKKHNRSSITERTREMTELLLEHGVGVGHPIVWVGHSKGGLFIKQILVDAFECGRVAVANLWRSSRGVFFYSVPHRGSPLADFNLPLLRQSLELKEIQLNCPLVMELHRRFVALYRTGHLNIKVFSFVETALTFMSVLFLRIVGVDSADPGIGEVCGVHLDHREICKPRSRNCVLYTELKKMINSVS